MDKFLYVFSESAKDKLIDIGYTLIKEDKRNSIYIFQNKFEYDYNLDDVSYVFSNTLTF